jgi:L,D-transpeptidase ErfK/SrfK
MDMIFIRNLFAKLKPSGYHFRNKSGSFLSKILTLYPSSYLCHCFVLLAFVSCLPPLSTCSAKTQSYRGEALCATDRLRKISPPAKLMEEYVSILSTFDEGDVLSMQDKTGEAERLYQLVLLKSNILDKKLHFLGTSSTLKLQPASPSDYPGDMNWTEYPGEIPATYSGPKKDTLKPEGFSPSVVKETNAVQPSSPFIQDDSSENGATERGDRAEDVEEEVNPVSCSLMTGKEFFYTVKKRESLRMIGAKLGVGWRSIARENGLDPGKPLESGQELVINTRRIIPKILREGIIINIPDRTLYLFKKKKLEMAVPVALGMPTYQDYADWRTPTGRFRILSKMKNPTWHVPPSIQAEMKLNKKEVVTEVPPSGNNPLGKFALKTSLSGILIHSTTHPESIYHFASHGCIRVNPKNMEEIFPEIPVHTQGEIIYQPVKLALSDDGRVFIEVHGDIYKRFKKLDDIAKELIIKNNAERLVDWDKVRTFLRRKSGIPEDITLEVSERGK